MKKVYLFILSLLLLGSLSASPVLADLSYEQGLTDWTVAQRADTWPSTSHEYTSDVVTDRYSDGVQSVRLGAKVIGDESPWEESDKTQTIVWKNGTYDLTHGLSVSVDMADIQHAIEQYDWGWGMEADLILSDGTNETRSLLWDYHEENTGGYGPAGLEDNLSTSTVTGADGNEWFRYRVPLTADKWYGTDFGGGPLSGLNLSSVKIGVVYAAINWHSSPQTLWANGLVDNVRIEYEPSTPTITGFINPTLACGAVTNIHTTTVDWTDSTGGVGGIVGYEYEVDYPKPDGSRGIWNTFFTSSQNTGSLNEGIHYINVRAKDSAGNYSEWSNVCSITADWTAPDVEITNPLDGSSLLGTVDIRGSVEDNNPHHYWFVVEDSSGVQVAGPGVVNDTSSFTDKLLLSWDTTSVPEGIYTIKLEARDAAGNKDDGSVDWHTVTVNNTPDNKDDCKKDGWESFGVFKNQGDCVSFVATGGKNLPAGE